MQSAFIDFLPCRDGGGYSAVISGFWGNHDTEGWVVGAYGNLRGVAVEPEAECLECSGWMRVVRRRLPEQGVVFIPQENVQSYLDTEGVYWVNKWGGTSRWPGVGRWHHIRKPSFGERLLWRWQLPLMPIDRELTRQDGVRQRIAERALDRTGTFHQDTVGAR
ncbi:MAG TPA: hypothetical protein VGC15_19850 [Acetobacteraceae bacterium]